MGLILTINREDMVGKVKVTRILGKLSVPSGSVKQECQAWSDRLTNVHAHV